MKVFLNRIFTVILISGFSFTAFPGNKISFTSASLESFYTKDLQNIIEIGKMKFEFGRFYGSASIVQFCDYTNAIILEDIEDSIPAIGFYKGGSYFFPLNLGFKPLNKLSINLNISTLTYSSSIQTGPNIYYYYGDDVWASYRIYGIPIKYSMGLGIKYQLFENNHFSLEWSSGVRMYGYPSLDDSISGTVAFQGTTPDILRNPEAMETGNHKKNIFFIYTGAKIRGPLFQTGSKTPSREMAYACFGCLHAISTLDLGYSNSSTGGRIKYIAADCALGAITGALEQSWYEAWTNKDNSGSSKFGKKIVIGLVGGLIWELGTGAVWASCISSGGSGSDYMARDLLFFASLQAGLTFHIAFSANFEE